MKIVKNHLNHKNMNCDTITYSELNILIVDLNINKYIRRIRIVDKSLVNDIYINIKSNGGVDMPLFLKPIFHEKMWVVIN